MNNYKIIFIACSTVFLMALSGCSKLLEVETPRNQLTTDKVFADSLSAISALGNVYYTLANGLNGNYNKYISLYTDEYGYTALNEEFYDGRLSAGNGTNANIWSTFYEIIYSCNDILERAGDSDALSERTKHMLINEVKFVRAFCYYHLYALYENVPLLLTTDVDENRTASQVDSVGVFSQIIADLTDAKGALCRLSKRR